MEGTHLEHVEEGVHHMGGGELTSPRACELWSTSTGSADQLGAIYGYLRSRQEERYSWRLAYLQASHPVACSVQSLEGGICRVCGGSDGG